MTRLRRLWKEFCSAFFHEWYYTSPPPSNGGRHRKEKDG